MKKTIIIFLLPTFILINFDLLSQDYPESSFGIRAGVNLNSWTNDFPPLDVGQGVIFPEKWVTEFGYHGGIYGNIRLSELIALEPILLYTLKGTGSSLEDPAGTVEGIVDASYLDFSFLVRLYVADGFNIFIGPQLSYLLSADFEITLDGTTVVDSQDITDDLSELDAAGILGLGYEFHNGINLNLAGELGFLTVDGFEILSTFNRTIRFSLGYNF